LRVTQGSAAPDFDPTMAFVDGLVIAMDHLAEVALSRPVKPFDHIAIQAALIGFKRQRIIGVLVHNLLDNGFLTANGMNR
jgi:hypothetical protein